MRIKMSKENIDVSKCMYFRMNNKMPMCRACNSGVGSPYCEYHKDCYYRQLKRLEQENERLKEENEELCDRMAKVTYRATGGRLSYSNYTLDAIEQAFYDQLEILSDQKSEIYKQALQEIRDMADENKDTAQYRGICISIIDKINDIGVEE
jgi:hypothetical protein